MAGGSDSSVFLPDREWYIFCPGELLALACRAQSNNLLEVHMNGLRFSGFIFGILSLIITCSTEMAFGGAIIQDQTTGCPTFARDLATGIAHTTFAQSFTAEDSVIASIGFQLADANTFLGGLEFTVTLFDGEGTGGPVLASVTRSLTSLPP
jgi:hypothetical protein